MFLNCSGKDLGACKGMYSFFSFSTHRRRHDSFAGATVLTVITDSPLNRLRYNFVPVSFLRGSLHSKQVDSNLADCDGTKLL